MNEETTKKETIFAKGFYFDKARDGAPAFVKGRLSIKVEDAIEFLKANRKVSGYVNCDLLKKKDGSGYYFTLDQWEPKLERPSSFNGPAMINAKGDDTAF